MKKKILLITSRADHGGGPKHILNILEHLGGDFAFFIACPNDYPYYQLFKKYGPCFYIPHRQISLASIIYLLKKIEKEKIDLIHSHGRGAGLYSRILGLITKRTVIHTFHGVHYAHLSISAKFIYINLERLLSMFTDAYINVTKSEQAECRKARLFPERKSVIISNAVDIPEHYTRVREKVKFNIINVSRIAFEKGSDILLEIAYYLLKLTSNFKLIIVGNGEFKKKMQEKIKIMHLEEYVILLGFRNDINEHLKSADIYISSSRGEAQGIAVLEAMSWAMPVIVSNVIGHIDIVRHGYNGYLFDLSKPMDAARYLYQLMNDEAMYKTMSINNYNYVSENYSMQKMCESIKKVYLQ